MLTDFNGFLNMGSFFWFSELDDCFRQLVLKEKSKRMSPPLDQQNIEITLPNQLGYERIAMASAETFAKMLGLSPERIEDLKTIVAEASINAMQHGNKERPDARVTVSMTVKENAIQVTVMDQGEGFSAFLPDPDIERIVNEQDPPVGFGTFLIRQLADQVKIDKAADGANIVRMTIKL
jgi:anti-sigma regulatory factor (Ser/Thr protein kinase)